MRSEWIAHYRADGVAIGWVSVGRARKLVDSGRAEWVIGSRLTRRGKRKPVQAVMESASPVAIKPAEHYEEIFKHHKVVGFAGGLTRTESQPARIPKFKAARVSHA